MSQTKCCLKISRNCIYTKFSHQIFANWVLLHFICDIIAENGPKHVILLFLTYDESHFSKVCCSGIPGTLVISPVFWHEKTACKFHLLNYLFTSYDCVEREPPGTRQCDFWLVDAYGCWNLIIIIVLRKSIKTENIMKRFSYVMHELSGQRLLYILCHENTNAHKHNSQKSGALVNCYQLSILDAKRGPWTELESRFLSIGNV